MVTGTKDTIPSFHQANDGVFIYINLVTMGANATQLSKLDTVQIAATALCHGSFIPLQHHDHVATVGLLLIVVAVNFCRFLSYFSLKI